MTSERVALVLIALCSAAFPDVKSTNRMTVAGQSFPSTVLIKEGKIRNEMAAAPGSSTITIQDCAGHRLIRVNDQTRSYMATDISENSDPPSASAASTGTVTMNVNQQDTGERRQLFGYTARHIKGTISSPEGSGACSGSFHVATDGWYIDLAAAQGCTPPDREILRSRMERNGCKDRLVLKTTGIQKLGYPVLLDTIVDERGNKFALHQEAAELSEVALDASLFEIPAGYSEVHSFQELMGIGSAGLQSSELAAGKSPSSAGASEPRTSDFGLGTPSGGPGAEKKTGVLRIGVMQVVSGVETSLATDGWQQELASDINLLGGQAVLLSADSYDREAALEQGKEQGCDYVVFTKVTNFKSARVGEKLGKVFNRGGGAGGTGQGRIEIAAEVKVFEPASSALAFGGTADFRQNDPDSTWKGLMRVEAREVMLELRKQRAAK